MVNMRAVMGQAIYEQWCEEMHQPLLPAWKDLDGIDRAMWVRIGDAAMAAGAALG